MRRPITTHTRKFCERSLVEELITQDLPRIAPQGINLRDSTAWGILWTVAKKVIPNEVIVDEAAIQKSRLPHMDCNQCGVGEDFNFVIPIDGTQHVLTCLEKAPPYGFAAINYAKSVHPYRFLTFTIMLAAQPGRLTANR